MYHKSIHFMRIEFTVVGCPIFKGVSLWTWSGDCLIEYFQPLSAAD